MIFKAGLLHARIEPETNQQEVKAALLERTKLGARSLAHKTTRFLLGPFIIFR
jgi:hypothetical protein